MDEQLTQALALIAARLEGGGQQLLNELLPAALRDAVSQASTAVTGTEGESLSILLRELQPPERQTAAQESDSSQEEASESGKADSASAPGNSATLTGILLGLVAMAATPERAARFLDQLPRHMQGQLLHALVVVSSVSASRQHLGTEAAGIAADLRGQLGVTEEWGVDKAVQIVRALEDDGRMGQSLAGLAATDRKALAELQNRLFEFDDLMKLPDAELQVLMMQVDNGTLGRALQKTSEEAKKRLYANMSARRRRIVAEEEEHYQEATPEEIQEAQGAVMDAVRELYRTRKIDTYFGSAQEESRPRPRDEARERTPAPAGTSADAAPAESGTARPAEGRTKTASAARKRKSPLGAVLAGLGAVVLIALAWMWFGGGTSSTGPDKAKPAPAASASSSSSKGGSAGPAAGELRAGSDVGGQGASAAPEVTQTPVRKTRMTAAGKAVLELPETQSEVEPISDRAQVYHEQTAEAEEPKGVFMSVGRVRTTILDKDFYVRTPIVKITGSQGAVFETRVVIDRTTYVEVEAGQVAVAEAKGSGSATRLTAGQKARFDP